MASAPKPRTAAGRYQTVDAVEVHAWGRRVGAVAQEPTNGFYAFAYDPAWVRTGVELAPLTMPLAQADRPFIFPELPEATYQRLPALLADALPDDFGNALIDAWMAERGLRREAISALDRLAYMGQRGMGALGFRPMRGPRPGPATALQMGKLVDAARLAVQGDFDSDAHTHAALRQIIQVGTSAGGARAKATIAWNSETQEVRTGQFDMPEGFEAWLLKFDGVGADRVLGASRSYGRIEYAYHLMATAAGVSMSPCGLLHENGRAHFMTRRFDRQGNQRHHLQTLCAIAHLDFKRIGLHSYHQYLQTAQALGLGRAALAQILRRMVFNVLAANCDDHTKNASFLLREGGAWELAPAYDITHAYRPDSEWVSQHQMSVNGKFRDITRADVRAVAERFDLLAELPPAIDAVLAATADWMLHAQSAGVSREERSLIQQHLRTRRAVFAS